MDISEKFSLVRWLMIPVASWLIFRLASHVSRSTLWVSLKSIAGVVGVLSTAFVLLLMLLDAGCSRHAPSIKSPDGKYVAVVRYVLAGALGADAAIVKIRSRWN